MRRYNLIRLQHKQKRVNANALFQHFKCQTSNLSPFHVEAKRLSESKILYWHYQFDSGNERKTKWFYCSNSWIFTLFYRCVQMIMRSSTKKKLNLSTNWKLVAVMILFAEHSLWDWVNLTNESTFSHNVWTALSSPTTKWNNRLCTLLRLRYVLYTSAERLMQLSIHSARRWIHAVISRVFI